MNTYDLAGQVAVVTGGAQGIGLAVARRLHASGAHVCLWDMDADLAAGRAEGAGLDVTDASATQALADATFARLGRLDVLVNSAGIAGSNGPLEAYPVEEFHRIIEVNLHGTFHACRAILPHMHARGYGRIVNIASVAGKEGNPNAAPKAMGKENAGTDIAVNCVTPAAARTRIFDQMSQSHIDFMLSKIPRARFLEVDEAAAMIVWMCTKENSFTTAGVFDLSGGRATY